MLRFKTRHPGTRDKVLYNLRILNSQYKSKDKLKQVKNLLLIS